MNLLEFMEYGSLCRLCGTETFIDDTNIFSLTEVKDYIFAEQNNVGIVSSNLTNAYISFIIIKETGELILPNNLPEEESTFIYLTRSCPECLGYRVSSKRIDIHSGVKTIDNISLLFERIEYLDMAVSTTYGVKKVYSFIEDIKTGMSYPIDTIHLDKNLDKNKILSRLSRLVVLR